MKLIIARHGETEENIKKISQGHAHGTLSANGTEQAKKLALRLKNEKIDAVYSSDLGRAANTAKEAAKFHPNLEINFTEMLRERDLKELSGKPGNEIDWYDTTGKIESISQLMERAKKFIDSIYKKHKKDTILVLGHGAINAAILAVLLGKDYADTFLMHQWQNTNVTIVELYEDKSHKIHCINCVQHLEN